MYLCVSLNHLLVLCSSKSSKMWISKMIFIVKLLHNKNNLLFLENNLLFLCLSKNNLLNLKNNMLFSLNRFDMDFKNSRAVLFLVRFGFSKLWNTFRRTTSDILGKNTFMWERWSRFEKVYFGFSLLKEALHALG